MQVCVSVIVVAVDDVVIKCKKLNSILSFRRKKKCIRYLEALRASQAENRHDGDNLGSVGSVEAPTPDSKSTDESDSADLSPPNSEYPHFMSPFGHFSPGPSFGSRMTSLFKPSPTFAATPNHMPPRNGSFSIEQLARPHCPQWLHFLYKSYILYILK